VAIEVTERPPLTAPLESSVVPRDVPLGETDRIVLCTTEAVHVVDEVDDGPITLVVLDRQLPHGDGFDESSVVEARRRGFSRGWPRAGPCCLAARGAKTSRGGRGVRAPPQLGFRPALRVWSAAARIRRPSVNSASWTRGRASRMAAL